MKGWYIKQLKENEEKLKVKKRKEKIEKFYEEKRRRRFEYEIPTRAYIMGLLLTQGAIPKYALRPSPDKRSIYYHIRLMAERGFLHEETINGKRFIVLDDVDKQADDLRSALGDMPISYYYNFVSTPDGNGEVKQHAFSKTSQFNSRESNQKYLLETERLYRVAYIRTLLSLAGIKCTVVDRPVLHIADTLTLNEPVFYSSLELKNEVRIHHENYQRLSDMQEGIKKVINQSRSHGLLMSEGGMYSVYNTDSSMLKWNTDIERYFCNNITEICEVKGLGKSEARPLLFASNYKTATRIVQNERNEKILKTLVCADARVNKEFYLILICEESLPHIKEMTTANWQIKNYKRIGLLKDEVENASSDGRADGIRHIGKKTRYILDFCVPNIVKLKKFATFVSNNKNPDNTFEIHYYKYQELFLRTIINDSKCTFIEERSEYEG